MPPQAMMLNSPYMDAPPYILDGRGPPPPWNSYSYFGRGNSRKTRHHTRVVRNRSWDFQVGGDITMDDIKEVESNICKEDQQVLQMSLLSIGSDEGDSGTVSCDLKSSSSSSASTSDSVSVTSDEGNADVMLPRIIKPRKRRKKDRKPSSNGGEEAKKNKQSPQGDKFEEEEEEEEDEKTFVTLKPYIPSCYDNSEDMSDDEKTKKQCRLKQNKENDDSDELHHERVCGCDKCVPNHSFPTPPSSPSSSASYTSKMNQGTSNSQTESPGVSTCGSDDEAWPPPDYKPDTSDNVNSNSINSRDRQLVRSYSEPTTDKSFHVYINSSYKGPNNPMMPPYGFNNFYGAKYQPIPPFIAAPRRPPTHRSYGNVPDMVYGNNNNRWNDSVKYCVNSLNNTIKRRHSLNSQRNIPDFAHLHQIAGKVSILCVFSTYVLMWITAF